MNVLSLFDGISCGQVALNRAGIKYDKYYASEIDKYAIKVAKKNFPDTIEVGSVFDLPDFDLPEIDLLIGGSPCQSFSNTGDGSGFNGKSKLFFEFAKAKRALIPKYFFFENVKMKKEWQKIISKELGVEPIEVNSSLVSAQNRVRLYWTNIPIIGLPDDKNICLEDIIEKKVEQKYYLSEKAVAYINREDRIRKKLTALNGDKAMCLMAYYDNSKNGTFLCVDANGRIDGTKSGTLTQRYAKGVENYGSNPFIKEFYGLPPMKPDNKSKDYCMNATAVEKDWDNFMSGKIRKFTPVECERLQTLPDNYTDCISNCQRYRAIGNGWTVDIVSWFFSFLKGDEKKLLKVETELSIENGM